MEKSPALAVDAIIVDRGALILIKRRFPPFQGQWAFPGGYVDDGETVEEALKREVKEETGLDVVPHRLVGVYSDPHRDPRHHVVSTCFLCTVAGGTIEHETAETLEVKAFPLRRLPGTLAFDHSRMLADSGVLGRKVMVGGKFNILHPGHLAFLREAKALGDLLIVVIATDATVKRTSDILVMPAGDRKTIMEHLRLVDKAVIGDPHDFFKIVEQEQPDIIALGYDQTMDEEWLRERLQQSGLSCRLVKIRHQADGYSTRKLVEKIRAEQ